MVALVTNVRNYVSANRGTVVSIVEAAFSAGPSLLSFMYGVLYMHGELNHPGIINLQCNFSDGYFIYIEFAVQNRLAVSDSISERQNMGGFFLTMAILHAVVNTSSTLVYGTRTATRTASTDEKIVESINSNESIVYSANTEEMRLVTEKQSCDESIEQGPCGIVWRRSQPVIPDSVTDHRLLQKSMYHYILWPFICSSSIQLTLFTNLTFYLRSFNNSEYNMAALILVPSVGVVTKLTVGVLSDRLLDKCPRSIYLLIINIAQLLSLLLFMFFVDNIYIYFMTIVVTGSANGVLWCLTPTILSEYFHQDHFGRNWGWTLFAGSLFGCAVQALFGVFYEISIDTETGINCYGRQCYYASSAMFVVLAAVAVIGNAMMVRRELRTKIW